MKIKKGKKQYWNLPASSYLKPNSFLCYPFLHHYTLCSTPHLILFPLLRANLFILHWFLSKNLLKHLIHSLYFKVTGLVLFFANYKLIVVKDYWMSEFYHLWSMKWRPHMDRKWSSSIVVKCTSRQLVRLTSCF